MIKKISRNKKESDHQKEVVNYCRKHKIPIWGSASGIYIKDISLIRFFKALGIIAEKGEPDLFIPVVKRNEEGIIIYGGLFIELKKEGGVASKEQKAKIAYYHNNGYMAKIIVGSEDAIKKIKDYLNN